ncbi:MAG: hypothetical protein V1695_01975 [Candidatus Uhrbacteria bacterium]
MLTPTNKTIGNDMTDPQMDAQALLAHLGATPLSSELPHQDKIEQALRLTRLAMETDEYQKLVQSLQAKKIDRDTFFGQVGQMISRLEKDERG